ncbi:hypothetical protein [Verrucomicrobium spinosum]|nr:hypothetical protein [Verrucomicrobium spinosum]
MAGFWSKEGILAVAYPEHGHGNGILFAMAVLTATLTAFYMTRLVVVAFFGKARSKDADHAHEAPLVMILPLVVLAFPSVLAGYHFLAEPLQALVPNHHEGAGAKIVMGCSLVAVIVGFLAATRLYKNADKDPVNIPLFANKFYIDEFYAGLVKYGQDRFAWLVTALERIFVDGLTVRLPAALASGLGGWMRGLQSGSLQAYTFVLGLGIVVVVYLAVFFSTKP